MCQRGGELGETSALGSSTISHVSEPTNGEKKEKEKEKKRTTACTDMRDRKDDTAANPQLLRVLSHRRRKARKRRRLLTSPH